MGQPPSGKLVVQQPAKLNSLVDEIKNDKLQNDLSNRGFTSQHSYPITTDPSDFDSAISLNEYANRCQQIMGKIPRFSCKVNGSPIPVSGNKYCPQLGGNECITGSYAGSLDVGNNKVTTLFICRKSKATTSDNLFHDMAIVQHNRETGDTCWFQTDPDSRTVTDGFNAPSPMGADANGYWLEPKDFGPLNCQRCHDADPFILTLYVAQVFGESPTKWNPNGKYYPNFQRVFHDPTPKIFSPPENKCISCHRYGENTVIGKNGATNLLNKSIEFQTMPPGHGLTGSEWLRKYQADLDQLKRCGQTPLRRECNPQAPIPACRRGEDLHCGYCYPVGQICR
ncbi:MAG: hypothetical protein GQ475_01705 [Methylococcaceae bacterium]|nr:hypothetical protein [Methylococcaceae bacterium]